MLSRTPHLSRSLGRVAVVLTASACTGRTGMETTGAAPGKDTLAPAVSIATPADGAYANLSSYTAFPVTGGCETGLRVELRATDGSIETAPATAPLCIGAAFATTIDLTALGATITLSAAQTDAAGNVGRSSPDPTIIKDIIGPTITVGAPSPAQVASGGAASIAVAYAGAVAVELTPDAVVLDATGDAACTVGVTDGTTPAPTVTLGGCSGNGTVGITIASGTSVDVAGNPDAGSAPSATLGVAEQRPLRQVFYAVGQNTSDHKTGDPRLTIVAGVATFSIAQTATNLGIGDRITYDTSARAHIAGKISASQWRVVTATGQIPPDVPDATVSSIRHEFASLSAAEAGASDAGHLGTADLVLGNYVLNLPCYHDTSADTAAVVIDGYETGPENYVRIYAPYDTLAEVNQSQRHDGKWSDSRFRLRVAGARPIDNGLRYTRIEGLQVDAAGADIALYTSGGPFASLSGNIVKNALQGIYGLAYGWAWNNLVYDAGDSCFWLQADNHVYNNTAHGCRTGFNANSSGSVLKNNLVQASVVGYAGSFDVSSSHNLSDHADAPGTSTRNTASVLFADQGRKDFHLARGDSAARDRGADLSIDDALLVAADIDRAGRGAAPDIGADEAPTMIYFSVGQAPANHVTGAPTLAIAAGVATFSVPQTSSVIGVGDAVNYNRQTLTAFADRGGTPNVVRVTSAAPHGFQSGDQVWIQGTGTSYGGVHSVTYVDATHFDIVHAFNGPSTGAAQNEVFISGKLSESQWTVVDRFGAAPNPVSGLLVDGVTHEFSSLHEAIQYSGDPSAMAGGDLVAKNVILNLPCYYDTGPDPTPVVVSGYTTGPENYVRIYTPADTATEVNQSQRHQGVWDPARFQIVGAPAAYGSVVQIELAYVKVEGLQVEVTGAVEGTNGIGVHVELLGTAAEAQISTNIVRRTGGSANYVAGIWVGAESAAFGNPGAKIWNNVVYDFTGPANAGIEASAYGSPRVFAYNNTVSTCARGISVDTTWGAPVLVAKNNIVQGSTSTDFDGAFAAGSDHNLSDWNTGVTGGANDKANAVVSFVDAAADDFHLAVGDTAAKDAGASAAADLDLYFTTDVDGQPRASAWDIGADES
ncbi:MAG: hypothetical protein HY903_02715 [Deltaproteobacteria bacterium]|nr:hypothetical protein [Deltaproteobacteria bacterium]